MMVWSPEQRKACRVRDLIKTFEHQHLPWCVEPALFYESDCNCHGPNREAQLTTYAEWFVTEQDKTAELLKGK
jgi:hypothetical protein